MKTLASAMAVLMCGCSHTDLASIAKQAAPILLQQAVEAGRQIDREHSACWPLPAPELPAELSDLVPEGSLVLCYAPYIDVSEFEEDLAD